MSKNKNRKKAYENLMKQKRIEVLNKELEYYKSKLEMLTEEYPTNKTKIEKVFNKLTFIVDEQIKNYKNFNPENELNLLIYYVNLGDKLFEKYKFSKNFYLIAHYNFRISKLYIFKMDFKSALIYSIKAISTQEFYIKNDINGNTVYAKKFLATIYSRTADIYKELNLFNDALIFYNKSIETRGKTGFIGRHGYDHPSYEKNLEIYSKIASYYRDIKDFENEKKFNNEYNSTLKYMKRINYRNMNYDSKLASCYENIKNFNFEDDYKFDGEYDSLSRYMKYMKKMKNKKQ